MRPQIPDQLESHVTADYESLGYQSEGELVRDATRRLLDGAEASEFQLTPDDGDNQ